jgi:hypothetical protein
MKNRISKFLPTILFISLFVWFFARTRNAKISADDAGFLKDFANGDFGDWYNSLIGYVPGRNLHILWQDTLLLLTGTNINGFWKYHLIQSLAYTLVFVAVYLIIMRHGGKKSVALVIGLGMALFPLYTSVLLWASALPMHLFSTLFLLVGLGSLSKKDGNHKPDDIRKLVPGAFLLGLAMFTYDQSAAVVLFITLLVLFAQASRKFRMSLPIHSSKKLLFMLLAVSVFYLLVFFLGRGTGNNLTVGSGTLGRLSGNILLPIKAYLKIRGGFVGGYSIFQLNPYVALFINLGLFLLIVAICLILFKRLRSGAYSASSKNLFSSIFFLCLAGAAYMPSAIWYVAPRHLFLPVVLGSIFVGIMISEFLKIMELKTWVKSIAVFSCALLFISSSLGVSRQISSWNARDNYRVAFYNALNSHLGEIESPCIVISQKLNNVDSYLYSENINAALKFYSGQDQVSEPKCDIPATETNEGSFICQDSNQNSWYEIRSYSLKYSGGNRNYFDLKKIC